MSDSTPSSTEIVTEMEARHVHEAAFAHLVGRGMHADRDLMRLVDTSPVTVRKGAVSIPHDFSDTVRRRHPTFFAEASFDARTAKPEEVEARLAIFQRGALAKRAAAANARTLAELRTGR